MRPSLKLTNKLGHTLFGLCLLADFNAKVGEVLCQQRVYAGVIAGVTINVGRSFWLDGTKLESNWMPAFFCMCKRVAVASRSAKLLSAAPERTASQTKPQILVELAFGAVRQS